MQNLDIFNRNVRREIYTKTIEAMNENKVTIPKTENGFKRPRYTQS